MCFDEKIISEVQKHPYLYDISHNYYYDSIKKKNAWQDISEYLKESVSHVKQRWTSLRDCYRKSLLKRKTKSGQAANTIKPWKYEVQMSFLNYHFGNHRPQMSNLSSINRNESECDHDIINISTQNHENEQNIIETKIDMDTPINKRKNSDDSNTPDLKIKKHKSPEYSSNAATVLKTYLDDKKTRKQSSSDHLTSFFKSMEDTVRTFPHIMQVEVKARISALVSHYEIQNVTNTTGHHCHNFIPSPLPSTSQYQQSPLSSTSSFQSIYEPQGLLSPTDTSEVHSNQDGADKQTRLHYSTL